MSSFHFPPRNPFPFQATTVARPSRGAAANGGDRPGADRPGAARPGADVHAPTLLLDPLVRAWRLARGYVDDFPGSADGQTILLRGEHGSGKTHTVNFITGRIADVRPRTAVDARPVVLYARIDGADFGAAFRALVKHLSLDELRDLGWLYLYAFASDDIRRGIETARLETGEHPGGGDHVGAFPAITSTEVAAAFARADVERSGVENQQGRDIGRIEGARRDLQNAFTYLMGAELADAACSWFHANPVDPTTLRKLGVSGPIADTEGYVATLQFLATLATRGGRPLLVCLDQYEKLLPTEDPERRAANLELIRKLVEALPRENALFLLAGTDEAWASLPKDVQARFGQSEVVLSTVTLDEAADLIRLYLSVANGAGPLEQERRPDVSTDDLFPVDRDAVRAIVTAGGGNVRRLLQTCHTVFAESEARGWVPVDAALVAEALRRAQRELPTEGEVAAQIERMLRAQPFRFTREFRTDDQAVDFAVFEGETPRLFVTISRALFHDQEARNALRALERVDAGRHYDSPPAVALVVLGYVSPDVVREIRGSVFELIVYDPATFAARFEALLAKVLVVAMPAVGTTGAFEAQLLETRASLQAILEQSKEQVRTLQTALQDRLLKMFQGQAGEPADRQRADARLAWADESRMLEERIRDARTERRQAELDEINRLTREARARTQKLAPALGAVLGIGVFLSLYLLPTRDDLRLPRELLGVVMSMVLFGAVAAGLSFLVLLLYRQGTLNGIVVSSTAELRRLVSADLPRGARARRHLRHSHPYFRYAAAIGDLRDVPPAALMRAFLREPSAIIRRALARSLGRLPATTLLGAESEPLLGVPEYIYAFEAMLLRRDEPLELPDRPPRHLRTLAMLRRGPGFHPESRTQELVFGQLPRMLDGGVEGLPPEILQRLTASRIRDALRELSPFDEGGLGTFDHLESLKRIDRLYLFLRELLFLTERGGLPAPPAAMLLPIGIDVAAASEAAPVFPLLHP